MAISFKPSESNISTSYKSSISSLQSKSYLSNSKSLDLGKSIKVSSSESTSNQEKALTDKQRVISKTSSQLYNASSTVSSRSTINESFKLQATKLKELAYKIEDEVDPTKKEDLVNQANELITSMENEYNEAISKDPYLSQNISISSLTKPGEDFREGNKTTSVFIEKITSPSESGLSSINFDDIETAITSIDTSISNFSQKAKSFEASESQISGATKNAISELEAKNLANASFDASSKDISRLITNSTESLFNVNNINQNTIESLLSDDIFEEKDTEDKIGNNYLSKEKENSDENSILNS